MKDFDFKPQKAVILLRLSIGDDTLAAQEKRCRRRLTDLGWKAGPDETHLLIEADTSAFKRQKISTPGRSRPVWRTVRPKFQHAIDMLWSGQADGIMCDDLDRLCRDLMDLEDAVTVVEHGTYPVLITSVSGTIDLSNSNGILAAQVNVSVAGKSSRDTARRVENGHRYSAELGRPCAGGRYRPFGFERATNSDGEPTLRIVESEAAEIRKAVDAILAWTSLNSIVRSMNGRVPTQSGASVWSATTLRQIIRNPRIAGIVAIHRVEEREVDGKQKRIGFWEEIKIDGIAVKGNWPAIIPPERWREVNGMLSNPARKRHDTVPWSKVETRGRPLARIGSDVYRCGVPGCNRKLRVNGFKHYTRYVCPDGGISRHAEDVDNYVVGVVTEWLSRPEAKNYIRKRDTDDTEGQRLREEANQLQAKDASAIRLHDNGIYDEDEFTERRTAYRKRIAEIERMLEVSHSVDPLDGIAGEPNAAELWPDLSMERQRAIIRELVRVTILPVGPGNRVFDKTKVKIEFTERRRQTERRKPRATSHKPERRKADRRTPVGRKPRTAE